MINLNKQLRLAAKAAVALSLLAGAGQSAFAAGTAAGTAVNNRATVNYSVGGVPQGAIESSPTGNSTATGADTSFVVDNRVDFSLIEVSNNPGDPTLNPATAFPGQTGALTYFRLTNEGNAAQAFALTAANGGTLAGSFTGAGTDNFDPANLRVRVDTNNDGILQASENVATNNNIASLAADGTIGVFILGDIPLGQTSGDFATVSLTAVAAPDGNPAGTLTESASDTAGVDILFGDPGENNTETAADQYEVGAPALTVAKTSATVEDPFNGTTNPLAVPGAFVEYTIVITNTGTVPATDVAIADPVPTSTTFAPLRYNAGASDVRITVGASDTFCVAEAGGTDTNGDGCVVSGGALQVGAPALANVAPGAGNAVSIRFQVSID
ncbi:MAG: hypothetical protein R3E77_07030 [Steroidobacteraceae bacterium]